MTQNPIEVIQALVADAYGITVAELLGDGRREPLSTARQHAVHLCTVLLPGRTQFIAEAFGYANHTSALHASRVILGRAEMEPTLDSMHRRLLGQCMAAIDSLMYAGPWSGDRMLSAQCDLLDALHNLKIAYTQMPKDPSAAGYRIDTAMAQLASARAAIDGKELKTA